MRKLSTRPTLPSQALSDPEQTYTHDTDPHFFSPQEPLSCPDRGSAGFLIQPTMTFRLLTIIAGIGLSLCTVSCRNGEKAAQAQVADAEASDPATAGEAALTAINPDKTLPTVIDFNAVWCGPCQRFAPIFEQVSKEYSGKAIFISVDVDESPELARQFEVSAIPQLTVLMPDGSVKSNVGFMEKTQFIEFITPFIGK